MDKNDLKKFATILAVLQEALSPEKHISKERTKVYFDFLSDLTIEQIDIAARFIIKTKTIPSFPTIGEIRQAVFGTIEADAAKAWGIASKAAGRLYSEPDFKDPIIKLVIDKGFGGWEKFRFPDNPDSILEISDRKHFINCYKLLAVEQERAKEKRLKGIKQLKGESK